MIYDLRFTLDVSPTEGRRGPRLGISGSFPRGLGRPAGGVLLTAAATLWLAQACFAAEQPLVEWTFDRAGDLQGWQPNAHLADVEVSAGALKCRSVGSDPILELRPLLDVPASPWQVLEVRLQADRDGTAEWFWSNTTQTRYGGFAQEKSTRFQVIGDGQWRTYRVFPFWQPEKRIIRLRLDLYDAATFAVDFLRIAELAMPQTTAQADFDFSQGALGWQPVHGATLATAADGLTISSPSKDGFALAPPLRIDAEQRSFVTLRLAVDRGRHATLLFATEQTPGLQTFSFPIEADGHEHTYNLDLLAASGWRGQVIALGLRSSDAAGALARLRWLKVTDAPQGQAQLKIVSFALEDAVPRASRLVTLSAIVSNTGGETATNVRARLRLPPGVKLLSTSPRDVRAATLGFDEEATFSWRIQSPTPLTGAAEVVLACDDASTHASRNTQHETTTGRASLTFTPRPRVSSTGYVPAPKPVRGPIEVGVYYFPGWKSASQWHPIQRFPERKPVLGWYREGDAELADWHIKWAVEHGVTFFAYDWYWSQGARQLEHALHDGYFNARYRHLLKFCLLWANHNAPRTSSHDDCLGVTRYWIENYFHRPEHLTIDGKPAVIIFSPHRLTEDLGSAGVKKAFDAMRAECQRAGLKGLYLLACVGDAGQARQAATEGYDAVTAYNWPGLGMSGDSNYAPFATLLEGYRRNWEHILAQAPIPLLLPVNGGWDSRPWHGDNNLVRFGRTPELFKRHLLDAKQLLRTSTLKSQISNLVLIEAWNEWGEGSYIQPHNEFGFGYLDAIREVFTDAPKMHADLTPADVGLGPYDVPPQEFSRTVWDFDRDDEGRSNVMDLCDVAVRDGALGGRTTGHDPAFFGPPFQARAAEVPAVLMRLRLQRADNQPFRDTAQLFWRTSRLAESEASSARFEVIGDGAWHEYRIPVAENRRWRGLITRLRLDPGTRTNVNVEVDSIQLVK